jgi:hypothetical protein
MRHVALVTNWDLAMMKRRKRPCICLAYSALRQDLGEEIDIYAEGVARKGATAKGS